MTNTQSRFIQQSVLVMPPTHPMSPVLTRDSALTLTEQLVDRFAQRIRQHLLPPGSRLPSVRDCARTHGVSPYTNCWHKA